MRKTPVSRQPRLADSADKNSELGAPTRRQRCAASARCVAITPCRSPHSCTPPSHGMPRDTSPARSFVWETGLNFGQRRILAVARTDDQMARDRDLLPGATAARADERWRRRCRPGAPPVVRSAAGRRLTPYFPCLRSSQVRLTTPGTKRHAGCLHKAATSPRVVQKSGPYDARTRRAPFASRAPPWSASGSCSLRASEATVSIFL